MDPLDRFLSALANGFNRAHPSITVEPLPPNRALLMLLHRQGYVQGWREEGSRWRVYLPQAPHRRLHCRRLSPPSRRSFCSRDRLLRRHFLDHRLVVVSTSRGLMTTQEAVLAGLGGELLCTLFLS